MEHRNKFATTGRYCRSSYVPQRAFPLPPQFIHPAYYGQTFIAPVRTQPPTERLPTMHQYASLSALTGYAASPPYQTGYPSTSDQNHTATNENHHYQPQNKPPPMRRFRSLPRHYYSEQRLEARCIPDFTDTPAVPPTHSEMQESSMDSSNTTSQPPPSVYPPVAHNFPYRFENGSEVQHEYASSNNNYSSYGTAYRKNSTANSIYGSGYCANSYIGWHQQQQQPKSMSEIQTSGPMGAVQMNATPMSAAQSYQTLNINRDGSVVSDYPKDGCAPYQTIPTNDFPASLPPSSTSDQPGTKNKKCRFLLILGVLVIIIGVLIAMAAAVYSQVRTHDSVIRLVRQYRGYLLVTDGSSLEFDPRLLNDQSALFARKARMFEKKIDKLLQYSELRAVYEGCDVTAFRFVIAIPAMEVHFNIKTKVNVNVNLRDILTVLHDGIENNVGGSFTDSTVDLSSLTLENERLNEIDSSVVEQRI